MQKITLVAAIGQNYELGKDNDMLWDLPIDMQHFRDRTNGKPVIMGRRTFNSLGKPLPNRRNIVISRGFLGHDGIELVHSILEALELVQNEPDVMIMGGGEIYTLFLPYATHLSVTRIEGAFPEADAFFPRWKDDAFTLLSEKHYQPDAQHAFGFTIQEWERILR